MISKKTGKLFLMQLRYNPFHIFESSKLPAGLYARRKWLGESDTLAWKRDFDETVFSLLSGQSDDGSWNRSIPESIRHLFGLHLTIRNMTKEIERALGWLLKHTLNQDSLDQPGPAEPIPLDAFRELPFTPGETYVSIVCATLFLATIFGKGNDHLVMAQYNLLSRWVTENPSCMNPWTERNNVLRSFVVHPDYAEGPATITLVDHLARIQDISGRWPDQVPFCQTVNALAHVRLTQSHRQLAQAARTISDTQNKDGTWGSEDQEWNTFLIVHALKRKAWL